MMWRVLQHKEADDFVGATGEAHSVREFVEEAFRVAGISDWEAHVTIDEKNFRPSEIYNLRGDAGKAKRILGWQAKTKFKELAKVEDLRRSERSEEHTSELQSQSNLVCRLLLEKKKTNN